MADPAERRRVIVRGRVQGVFFRAATRERAVAANLSGWVRNCRDGSVEAVFEGNAKDVDGLVRWCRRGPAGARVAEVDVEVEPAEGLPDFRIR